MTRRGNPTYHAHQLMMLQKEFNEHSNDYVKEMFKEKGSNYQETKNFLEKMRSEANKENSSKSPIGSFSKIGTMCPILLKDYLRQDNFSGIENYIRELSQVEIQKVYLREFGEFKKMKWEFSGRTEYSARDEWINHLHSIHNENLKKTGEALATDKVLRTVIRHLYGLEFGKNEKDLVKTKFRLIDHLVQKRNVPMDCIKYLKPDQLMFDLHWFSVEGAKAFVKAVLEQTSGPELQLITGNGLHSISGESAIKKMLLDVYGDRIRGCKENDGKVILTVSKGPSTHYRLFI